MSDDSGKTFFSSIPLPGLVAVITGVMGTMLFHYEPLKSKRPAETPVSITNSVDPYGIESTLYEDPLKVIDRTSFKESPSDFGRSDRLFKTSLSLRIDVEERSKGEHPVLILPVFMKAGSEHVSSETRARNRLAIVQGLATSGYYPANGGRMECLRIPARQPCEGSRPMVPYDMDIPFEWFETDQVTFIEDSESRKNRPPEPQSNEKTPLRANDVLVLWLRGDSMESAPIERLRTLLGLICQPSSSKGDQHIFVRILGPPDTSGLVKMLKEALKWQETKKSYLEKVNVLWNGPIDVISHAATAPQNSILKEASIPIVDDIESFLSESSLNGGRFDRTITQDDAIAIATALVQELELRGIPLHSWAGSSGQTKPGTKEPHVVLISEFDTLYGRSFSESFRRAIYRTPEKDTPPTPSQLHYFKFPRGLDGRSSGTAAKAEKEESKAPGSQPDRSFVPGDTPYGTNQADALRRLALEIVRLEKEKCEKEGQGIQAIGLMGGDVFDKLWLLRALKPHFPRAVFFTNNLDAWLWQQDELKITRNLVVASPFGLSHEPLQDGKPPFRDSYQTSTYLATLAATAKIEPQRIIQGPVAAKLYEISTRGPHELQSVRSIEDPYHIGTILRITVVVLLVTLVYWAIPDIWNTLKSIFANGGAQQGMGGPWKKLSDKWDNGPSKSIDSCWSFYITHPLIWLPVILASSIPIVRWLSSTVEWEGEPVQPFQGISAWPAEWLRIVAILLAVHLTGKIWRSLRENARALQDDLNLVKIEQGKPKLSILSPIIWGLECWFWPAMKLDHRITDPSKVDRMWTTYRRYTGNRVRAFRSLFILAALVVVYYFLENQFGRDRVPIRGNYMLKLDGYLGTISNVAFLWITALVVDAMWTGRMFAHLITRDTTDWGNLRINKHVPHLIKPNDACDYLDLRLIAGRTDPIVSFAFYPFYILALLVLARCDLFDHWTWQPGVIIAYTIAIGIVLISAKLLRNTAEDIRAKLIRHLTEDYPTPRWPDSPHARLITEVRNEDTGAFSPISHQPVMKGIYWLVSGLGISGIWQYLSGIL